MDYKIVTQLAVYFYDLKSLKLLETKVSALELVKVAYTGINLQEALITPLGLTVLERSAQSALDLSYRDYKSSTPNPNSQDFQHVWLTSPTGRSVYEAHVKQLEATLQPSVSLEDLKA
jgi:hypothetical protein